MSMCEWISTNDRLPTEGEIVIFYNKYGEFHVGTLENPLWHKNPVWWEEEGWVEQEVVIYWMPLPALPHDMRTRKEIK